MNATAAPVTAVECAIAQRLETATPSSPAVDRPRDIPLTFAATTTRPAVLDLTVRLNAALQINHIVATLRNRRGQTLVFISSRADWRISYSHFCKVFSLWIDGAAIDLTESEATQLMEKLGKYGLRREDSPR